MKLRKVTHKRWMVVDRHTGETVKRYVRERDAIFSAADIALTWGKGRFVVKAIEDRMPVLKGINPKGK